MSHKHPWMAMKHALIEYRRLLAAGQPDHRNNDGPAIDAQHDKGGHLERPGNVERELGEPERADDRNQKYEPHRKHNCK